MDKLVMEFLNKYNDSNKENVLQEIKKVESNFSEEHEQDLADIQWEYFDYTDKSFKEIAQEFDIVGAKRLFFELWYLNQTNKRYDGEVDFID